MPVAPMMEEGGGWPRLASANGLAFILRACAPDWLGRPRAIWDEGGVALAVLLGADACYVDTWRWPFAMLDAKLALA